jgi:hypothetical protein
MGIEYDISDVEKITIRITDSVSNESLNEFMQMYVTLLTSLRSLGQKRTLHIFIGGDASISVNPSNLLALYRFLHYKCRKLNRDHLDSIILYMNDKSVIQLVKGFSTFMKPVVPIRFYHLSAIETSVPISA